METVALGNIAFLDKTKKQAKRLLKLAQSKESTIQILNLASAQEILAQINGYPHWHALESSINQKIKVFPLSNEVLSIEGISLIEDSVDGVNYLIQNNKMTSFYEVTNLPCSEVSYLSDYVRDLKAKCRLQFNMGFHDVSLIISNRMHQLSHNNYNFHSLSNSLGIDESLAKKIFKINVSIEKKSKYDLSILLVVKTDSQMASEHAEFCKNFNNKNTDFESFSLRNYLTQEEKSILNKTEDKLAQRVVINNEYNLSLEHILRDSKLSKSEASNKAWIHSITLLSEKMFEWDIEVNLNENTCVFYQLKENKSQANYLAGLYKALNIDSEIVDAKIFEFENKKSIGLPWSEGVPFVNLADSDIGYYNPGSSLQSSHQTLVYGLPGSGKSLLLNTLGLFSLGQSVSNLPYIGTVDIGPSSKGLITYLKALLPNDKKHLAQYYRIGMSQEYCVNVFDTMLGSRFPTVENKYFLVNFLLLLVTDINKEHPEEAMRGLVESIIEGIYLHTSEVGKPKKYMLGIDKKVDEVLIKIEMPINDNTTWWEVVDCLFDNGFTYEAMLAQRHAVPVFADTALIAEIDKIRDIYSKVMVITGENLIQYFNRRLADSLNQYKILGQPTVFSIDEARVVSLDLDEVAKSGGVQAERQIAVMYMLSRSLIVKNYHENLSNLIYVPYNSKLENIQKIPTLKYQDYHRSRIKELSRLRKIICLDELHRLSGNQIVQNQIVEDMKNGKKFGIETILATQSLNIINNDIKSFITTLFIMDVPNKESIMDTFKLYSHDDQNFLDVKKVHGPRRGSPGVMFAKFHTLKGGYSKLLSFKPTPHLLCLLNTTYEDCYLKEKLLTKFSLEKTLDILIEEYPNSVRAELSEVIFSNEQAPISKSIDVIFDRLLAKYSD